MLSVPGPQLSKSMLEHDAVCHSQLHVFSYNYADIRGINTIAVRAKHTGMIIIGGGLIKHHIANANLMVSRKLHALYFSKCRSLYLKFCFQRNGADYSVYVNTAQEFDGSDSGARPDEAISWGKIKMTARPVKVVNFLPSISLSGMQESTSCSPRCRFILFWISLQIYGEASIIFPLLVAETFAQTQDKSE